MKIKPITTSICIAITAWIAASGCYATKPKPLKPTCRIMSGDYYSELSKMTVSNEKIAMRYRASEYDSLPYAEMKHSLTHALDQNNECVCEDDFGNKFILKSVGDSISVYKTKNRHITHVDDFEK